MINTHTASHTLRSSAFTCETSECRDDTIIVVHLVWADAEQNYIVYVYGHIYVEHAIVSIKILYIYAEWYFLISGASCLHFTYIHIGMSELGINWNVALLQIARHLTKTWLGEPVPYLIAVRRCETNQRWEWVCVCVYTHWCMCVPPVVKLSPIHRVCVCFGWMPEEEKNAHVTYKLIWRNRN